MDSAKVAEDGDTGHVLSMEGKNAGGLLAEP